MIDVSSKARPLWKRTLLVAGLCFLMAWKALRLPKEFWPQPMKGILKNWTWSMYRVLIGSWITRAYIDQPCTMKAPEPMRAKAEVLPEYRMTQEELQRFYDLGYLGPYPAFTAEQVKRLADSLVERRLRPNGVYGIVTDRDLHFEDDLLLGFMQHPAILERAAQLLGPDLACWRSQVFLKEAGGAAIQFHQASTHLLEDYIQPSLEPPDRNQLFQLTVWIALDDATVENGCLRFLPGTHKRIRTMRFGGKEGFYRAKYDLAFDADPATEVALEVPAGHFLMFSEAVIHGSTANTTANRRLAVNFKIIPPSVKVYADRTVHRSIHMGEKYPLDKWSLVLLRGEDRAQVNRVKRIRPVGRGPA